MKQVGGCTETSLDCVQPYTTIYLVTGTRPLESVATHVDSDECGYGNAFLYVLRLLVEFFAENADVYSFL